MKRLLLNLRPCGERFQSKGVRKPALCGRIPRFSRREGGEREDGRREVGGRGRRRRGEGGGREERELRLRALPCEPR